MALVLMLSSCKDEINLPYSDADKVYFEYEYQDPAWSSTHLIKRDSVTAAMGYLPNGQDRMEVKIPVKLLGSALEQDAIRGRRRVDHEVSDSKSFSFVVFVDDR